MMLKNIVPTILETSFESVITTLLYQVWLKRTQNTIYLKHSFQK
jgi:hypothetical protein